MLTNNQHVATSSKCVNDKFGMLVEVSSLDNIDMSSGYLVEEKGAKRKAKKALRIGNSLVGTSISVPGGFGPWTSTC